MRALCHKPPSRHGMDPASIQALDTRVSQDKTHDKGSESANVRVEVEGKKNQTKRTCYEKDANAEKQGGTRLIMNSCERE